jgi:penicillin-binding protein 2
MAQALQVSSDVYFYTLGGAMNTNGMPLQKTARELGIGSPTGVDLPGEGSGLLPTPEWRDDLYAKNLTDRPWTVGDNVNLAVGQGDLQADPLQMAVAYAAIANGGDVIRPHVGLRVEDPNGRVVQEVDPAPRRHVDSDPAWQRTILDGIHAAAMEPGGTSYPVFGGFPIDVAGKTGTAETTSGSDQSWYVVLAPYPNPQIVCAVTIERGGFGADAAAPAAKQILESYFNFQGKKAQQAASGAPAPGSYD